MANSAGTVGPPNEGQTDMGRGMKKSFPYSKEQRKTGKTGDMPQTMDNPNTVDGNARRVNDPRLA